MKTLSIYSLQTGEITRIVTCQEETISMQYGDGESYLLGESNQEAEYINLATLERIPRPQMTAALDKVLVLANGEDVATVSGLPVPCTLEFNGDSYDITDGLFEFTADTEGTYTFLFSAWPYLDAIFIVEAIDA